MRHGGRGQGRISVRRMVREVWCVFIGLYSEGAVESQPLEAYKLFIKAGTKQIGNKSADLTGGTSL